MHIGSVAKASTTALLQWFCRCNVFAKLFLCLLLFLKTLVSIGMTLLGNLLDFEYMQG